MIDLKNIVTSWMSLHGYDGLYDSYECGCEISDLMPCGEPHIGCTAGYKVDCPKGHEFDFMIVRNRTDKCHDDL